ncbi:MAG: gamma-glutamylcyclotransferase [Deltaproteobacteria bacterium]|nr:gamma-glutamylcyclotransferase [Deltaproteobacteria bacterium]
MPDVHTLIFVYGTLLRGEPNHGHLRRARLVATAVTAPRYLLVDLGAFPAMLDGGRACVRGEVYACDPETLAALDRLEGHPRFYVRGEVVLARGPAGAQAYFLASHRGDAQTIHTGDWRAHRREKDDERDPMGAFRDLARGRLTPRALSALVAARRSRNRGPNGAG